MLLVRGIHDLTRDSDSRFLLVNAGYNTDWVISVTCQYLSTGKSTIFFLTNQLPALTNENLESLHVSHQIWFTSPLIVSRLIL